MSNEKEPYMMEYDKFELSTELVNLARLIDALMDAKIPISEKTYKQLRSYCYGMAQEILHSKKRYFYFSNAQYYANDGLTDCVNVLNEYIPIKKLPKDIQKKFKNEFNSVWELDLLTGEYKEIEPIDYSVKPLEFPKYKKETWADHKERLGGYIAEEDSMWDKLPKTSILPPKEKDEKE